MENVKHNLRYSACLLVLFFGLQEKPILVKFFYLNQQSSIAAVKEFRRMKQIRKGPMSPCALRKMIQKFETTGQLGILPGRGRKQIPSSRVEDVVPV
ncbi:hypothetical protein AVEN_158864-1 [Araneus ventricosus]|uniref:DUF4817 domain-containing protein n=1 Tax=Araneus ventricosus TaxID=182803 RepID=A0A4Y2E582_ARAVE|nr:hypothetical protein AVEN_158864-1 [Araneus ventricosus]